MPRFSSKRRVQHTAAQMFDLVADMERYPEFVPLCQSLKTRQRKVNADGTETVLADMTVSFKLVKETFTTRVTLDRANLKILVEYLLQKGFVDPKICSMRPLRVFRRRSRSAPTRSTASGRRCRSRCRPGQRRERRDPFFGAHRPQRIALLSPRPRQDFSRCPVGVATRLRTSPHLR